MVGKFVPGADRQAIVAAINAVADAFPQVLRDRPLMFDGEVGYTAARIDDIGGWEGIGRAGGLTGGAAAAMIAFGRVRRQRPFGIDGPQEQPAAMVATDQIAVLALPAKPRALR